MKHWVWPVEPQRKLKMTKAKDLVKNIVKKPEPNDVKPSFGTNPRDPWSATGAGGGIGLPESITSGRAELLKRYYKSRGYNINYISKNKRVGQSKTGDFDKWKRDHGIYEDESGFDQIKMREDNINDPQSACQSPFDGANTTDDVAPKKSKAAKMVKEIYSKHRIKEDMYDHEKDAKGPGSYGKPPKVNKKDEINSDDEKGVNARMVLKGGTTLTGEKRDTIEIDPMMKNRNKSPDYMSQDPKKQQQKPKEQ